MVAIVLAFASGYLGQQWNWLRPSGELLLLAELVGLIVLERHQLFEPVYQRVQELKAGNEELKAGNAELRAMLAALAQQIGAAGQVTIAVGTHESVLLRTRMLRQALAREQEGPQVLRTALLSGTFTAKDIRESSDDWQAYAKALSEFSLLPGSASSKGHRWSARTLLAIGSVYALENGLEFIHS